MADRIVVMHDGIIEQIGTPLDLYDAPRNLFVAEFIGSPAMNVIPGKLQYEGGATSVAALGSVWPVSGVGGGSAGQNVHYGIRPGDLKVADVGSPGTIAAEVVVVEPTGAETELLLHVGGSGDASGQQIILVMHGRTAAQPGDTVHLAIDGAKAHVFDGSSGQRL